MIASVASMRADSPGGKRMLMGDCDRAAIPARPRVGRLLRRQSDRRLRGELTDKGDRPGRQPPGEYRSMGGWATS